MSVRATNFVRRLRGLSPFEKLVAFVLADHDDHKGSGTHPSMTTVAEESGIKDRETASRITARLAEHKVIFSPQLSKGGRPTLYFFNYDLENCDSRITVAKPRTVIPQSQLNLSNRDSGLVEKGSTAIPQSQSTARNRDSPVTGRGFDDDEGRGKSSQDVVHGSNGDRLDDYKKIVLSKCKDSDGILSTALDIIIHRARRSGVNVSSPKYLEAALNRFDFEAGQDREDFMQWRRGRK